MRNYNHDLYKMLDDGYYGIGGFMDGGYLRQHPRESTEKYAMRRALSYYLNYLAPCVNAHVSPIFKTAAVREWKGAGDSLWRIFSEDVDFLHTNIANLMKRAAISAKLHGIAYIVMDRAEGDAGDLRLADLEEDRARLPYAYVVDIGMVEEVELDAFGRIKKFVFKEPDAKQEGTFQTRTMTVSGWELDASDGHKSGTWELGGVPVIPLASKAHKTHHPFPPSEFVSILKTNLAIYNMSSWLNDILVNQTFSVLTYPSASPESIDIGTDNALSYPPESGHAPAFIAPPEAPAKVLEEIIALLQQEIYRMAVVVNVTGSAKQQSGQAKAWDYEATNQILADFADQVERAEAALAHLFVKWTGVNLDYSVNYPNDFKISEVEQELANAEVAKGLGFGDAFNLEVFKRVLTSYLPELKANDFDELVAAYKEQQEEEKSNSEHDEEWELTDEENEAGRESAGADRRPTGEELAAGSETGRRRVV